MSARFAQIEPTTRCNFTCGFCAGRAMRQGDLPWETFERFLESNGALEHVELQGEGEPLMHPRFFDMVARCRERGIHVSLITNGSLLSLHASQLIASGVQSLDVSMESAVELDFQSIRGGKLSKVREGLATLMAARRAAGSALPAVGIAVTVLRRTLGALDGIIALYRELGLDGGIGVQPLQAMAGYTRNYDATLLADRISPDVFRRYLERHGVPLAAVARTSRVRRFYDDLFDRWHPDYGTCPWLDRGAYLTIDGEVRACAFHKEPHDRLGDASDEDATLARTRLPLADALRQGATPPPCAGCSTAATVTAHVQATRQKFAPY